MDYEIVEAWLWNMENYFALTGLTDINQQARFASTLLAKSAAVWMRNQNYNLTTLTFPTLK